MLLAIFQLIFLKSKKERNKGRYDEDCCCITRYVHRISEINRPFCCSLALCCLLLLLGWLDYSLHSVAVRKVSIHRVKKYSVSAAK
jgi:hypothetical protein